jgi:hypothetical protein
LFCTVEVSGLLVAQPEQKTGGCILRIRLEVLLEQDSSRLEIAHAVQFQRAIPWSLRGQQQNDRKQPRR